MTGRLYCAKFCLSPAGQADFAAECGCFALAGGSFLGIERPCVGAEMQNPFGLTRYQHGFLKWFGTFVEN